MPEPRPEKVAENRAKWQFEDGPVIGYPGRFVEEKRPDLAIQALDVIIKTYPNARLVFAGEYNIPYEQTWERLQPLVEQYKDRLIFLGLLKDPQEMAEFYAACDVCILPSDTECFALAQVEAMLSGTPMVMTDIPGGRVPVQVTGMGKLAKQGDAVSIGEAAVEVLQHREQYVKSRAHIEACFSLQDTVDGYERIFYQYARKAPHG
jgi:glycosyltransferase involved in cell wall biosynthesis